MSAGDIKLAYAASSDLVVTNLHSLAASAGLVKGWQCAVVDNTSNLYEDYAVTISLTTASANRQAGTINVYLFNLLDDTHYFGSLTANEAKDIDFGTLAPVLSNAGRLAAVMQVSATNAEVVGASFNVAPCFGGVCPAKFVIFITGNAATSTNAQLAASGNQVTVKGQYRTVAQS